MAVNEQRNLAVSTMMTKQAELNEFTLKGWDDRLSPDHFCTAIMNEIGGEFLDSNVEWKWWKYTDPTLFDEWNAKIEIIDVVHFYLSIIVMAHRTSVSLSDSSCMCPGQTFETGDEFGQYRSNYVGVDQGEDFSDIGLLEYTNKLNHHNYMGVVREMICNPTKPVYDMISTLDRLVSSMGLSSEEVSAIYSAKAMLNYIRANDGKYMDGTYVKVVDGVEDNARLEPLVEAFLEDSSMTLSTLEQNVLDAFYVPVP